MNHGAAPKISIIIAAYSPGDAVNRVIDSLDAQTLPQNEFEVIFVDDGSPDDTFDRLDRIAATRPNMRVFQIQNSGWPSRPRNLGTTYARGEYVVFMDHDDALYPDALRNAYAYAKENDADIVSVVEFHTRNVWWTPRFAANIPNVIDHGGIERLMPFMPHKLYRRSVLLDNQVRFPERPRALWEDWYINVGAYRHSNVVSVLADTPFYLRHMHGANTSNSFDVTTVEYWERLGEVMNFIVETLDGANYEKDRNVALARHIIMRVIDPMGQLVTKADPDVAKRSLSLAQQLLSRYTSDEILNLLSKTHRAQAFLLQAGRMDLVKSFHAANTLQRAKILVEEVRWRDGMLSADLRCVWESKSDVPFLRREGDRLLRAVSGEVEQALPRELIDVTEDAQRFSVRVRIVNRRDFTAWDVAVRGNQATYESTETGLDRIAARATAAIDIETGAFGRRLRDDVWDFKVRCAWGGMVRPGVLMYSGGPQPMARDNRSAVAYSNNSKGLSLDLAQRLRTFAIDARPRSGPAGPIEAFSTPLDNVAVVGASAFPASTLVAIADGSIPDGLDTGQEQRLLAAAALASSLNARVVADADGALLEGSASLPAGSYTVYVLIEGTLRRTRCRLVVNEQRQVQFS